MSKVSWYQKLNGQSEFDRKEIQGLNNYLEFVTRRNGEYFLIEKYRKRYRKDVAQVLGYSNIRDALNRHVDDEDKEVAKHDALGGKQDITIINESGLYSLILKSKLQTA